MKYDLYLDIAKMTIDYRVNPIIYGRMGDYGMNKVRVHIFNKGQPFNLASATIKFEGMTPSGSRISNTDGVSSIDAPSGSFTYTFPENCFDHIGFYHLAHFSIMQQNKKATTQDFSLQVLGTVDMTAPEAELIIVEFNKLIEEIRQIQEKELSYVREASKETLDELNTQVEELMKEPAWEQLKEILDDLEKIQQEIQSLEIDKITEEVGDRIKDDLIQRLAIIDAEIINLEKLMDSYENNIQQKVTQADQSIDKKVTAAKEDLAKESTSIKNSLNDTATNAKKEIDVIASNATDSLEKVQGQLDEIEETASQFQRVKLTADNGRSLSLKNLTPTPTSYLTLSKFSGTISLSIEESKLMTDYDRLPENLKESGVIVTSVPGKEAGQQSADSIQFVYSDKDMQFAARRMTLKDGTISPWIEEMRAENYVNTTEPQEIKGRKNFHERPLHNGNSLAQETFGITLNGGQLAGVPVSNGTVLNWGRPYAYDNNRSKNNNFFSLSEDTKTLTILKDCTLQFTGKFTCQTNNASYYAYLGMRVNGASDWRVAGIAGTLNWRNDVGWFMARKFNAGDRVTLVAETNFTTSSVNAWGVDQVYIKEVLTA
ncbi:BppU family phage baseplate upper protein [Enterococcus mundtii]|uniref:BppU N-terminal domain-containing protein n=1 Tax=Enterococcus mundtii TaxID=53346 RepID=A0A1V2UD05_ENTMU|nr:BppU family phage baseplate upper protein [Enterococcus mundtii]ONN41103.1 hypothetical protein BTN92_13605 [Enterococcus mundtii]